MNSRFDLIITHEPGIYNYRYVISLLREIIGDFIVVDSGFSVILLKTGDPYSVVEKIRSFSSFKHGVIYRVIPVDIVLNPYVEEIAVNAKELASIKIPVDKSFRVTLNGRLYWRETRLPARTYDAVRVIAEHIDRRVDLENPDYVVYVRSIKFYHSRRLAALTVTETRNILSFKSSKP
ncbi:MAG: THUMP domain-containing protein [Desulfurococcaceae archaeon]